MQTVTNNNSIVKMKVRNNEGDILSRSNSNIGRGDSSRRRTKNCYFPCLLNDLFVPIVSKCNIQGILTLRSVSTSFYNKLSFYKILEILSRRETVFSVLLDKKNENVIEFSLKNVYQYEDISSLKSLVALKIFYIKNFCYVANSKINYPSYIFPNLVFLFINKIEEYVNLQIFRTLNSLKTFVIGNICSNAILEFSGSLINLKNFFIGKIGQNVEFSVKDTSHSVVLRKLEHIHIKEIGTQSILDFPVSMNSLKSISIEKIGNSESQLILPYSLPSLNCVNVNNVKYIFNNCQSISEYDPNIGTPLTQRVISNLKERKSRSSNTGGGYLRLG